jgi:hypothetical protein
MGQVLKLRSAMDADVQKAAPLATQKDAGRAAQVAAVFRHWCVVLEHERARLDAKREAVILARLRDGYTVADLCLAIEGNALSPFHQGENETGMVYDSLTLIFRNGDYVDKFIKQAKVQRARVEQAKGLRADEVTGCSKEPEAPPPDPEAIKADVEFVRAFIKRGGMWRAKGRG